MAAMNVPLDLDEPILSLEPVAPERVIPSHGRCYDRSGAAELGPVFRWVK